VNSWAVLQIGRESHFGLFRRASAVHNGRGLPREPNIALNYASDYSVTMHLQLHNIRRYRRSRRSNGATLLMGQPTIATSREGIGVNITLLDRSPRRFPRAVAGCIVALCGLFVRRVRHNLHRDAQIEEQGRLGMVESGDLPGAISSDALMCWVSTRPGKPVQFLDL
jgi:hypothetical protein